MYANKVKKVVAVHDLSGVGRVSLTVVIPILSSMGFQGRCRYSQSDGTVLSAGHSL